MATKGKNINLAEKNDKEHPDKDEDRRFGIERREYEYFEVIPERRSGKDRRKNRD